MSGIWCDDHIMSPLLSYRLIGKGAFGEVYYGLLADVPRQQKALPVAIKVCIYIQCNDVYSGDERFETRIKTLK